MRRSIFMMVLVVVVVATALSVAVARNRAVTQPTRIHVVEHSLTDKVTDTGKPGDSVGDLYSWYNPVFDATDKKKIGHDQGDCVRVSVKAGSWECRWLTYIAGRGAIMVEGSFFDARNSTLAITGGTGDFRNARGSMKLTLHKGGYNFIFQLLP